MTLKVALLAINPGIQRDGTQFAAPSFVDGQWVRFQRKLPRKMGGYKAIFLNAPEISRGMVMQSQNGINYVYSGSQSFLEGWQTDNDDGVGYGPTSITLNNFTASANNLWQFDIGYDPNGTGNLNLIAHPGQNLADIDNTVNTPVLLGTFPYGAMSQVGVFTATGTPGTPNAETIVITGSNYLIGVNQTVTGTGVSANTVVTAVVVSGGNTTVTVNNAITGSSSTTFTFNNNISVSGGACMLYPYLFVYGNNGLIQNCSAGNFNNWVGSDANANNVSGTKVVKGMPLRGGTTSPAGLFWSLDQLTRVTYSPQTVGTSTLYWRYDIISTSTTIMSSNSVVEYDGIYYWVGVDRFLSYNGVVQEIPNNVNINYFFDNINTVQRQKVWATKITRWGEIWWFYPKGSATECTDAIIYNVREQTWYDAGQALGAQRSAGVFSEVFRYPIWAQNTPTAYQVTAESIVSGGTTYAVGDVVTLKGGAGSPAVFTVSSISGGGGTGPVTGLTIANGGSYQNALSGTLSTVARSPSSGTGLTITVTMNQFYTLWQHETGTDQVYLTNVDAINSYFETNSLGWVGGGLGQQQLINDNKWIRLERFEPDFVQSGTMSLIVTGKGYADGTDVDSVPYTFTSSTLKIDMKEQRREMRLRIISNDFNGNYQLGNCVMSVDMGDERSTGNP